MRVMHGRWWLSLVVLVWAGCGGGCPFGPKPGPSDDDRQPPANYAEWCRRVTSVYCNADTCEASTLLSGPECLATYERECEYLGEQMDALIADGKARFNADLALDCEDIYGDYYRAIAAYECADPTRPQSALAAFYRAYFGQIRCEDGVNIAPDIFQRCATVVEGLVAPGGSCAGLGECVPTSICANQADGGCGTCVNNVTTVGGACGASGDGGIDLQCPRGSICQNRRCVLPPGQGDVCDRSERTCTGACGMVCVIPDGAQSGTCQPRPTMGGCTSDVLCPTGRSCISPVVDAGFISFRDSTRPGTCVDQASAGEPCSQGINYDAYITSGLTGGISAGGNPVCGLDLVCTPPDGGSDGVCERFVIVPAGEPCGERRVCALGQICGEVQPDGTTRQLCAQRHGPGGRCESARQCNSETYCRNQDGGIGVCTTRLAAGSPCTDVDLCADLMTCHEGTCKSAEEAREEPVMCE